MKLSKIIYEYINQSGYTNAHYRRLYSIGVRGVKEAELDVLGDAKVTRVSVLPNKTAKLPDDCLNVLNIGVENGLGQLAVLKKDPTMTGYRKESDLRLEQDFGKVAVDTTRIRDFAYINAMEGSASYKAFGAYDKTSFVGSYKIEDGFIILNPEFGYDYLLVEGIMSVDETDVDVEAIAEETIIAYLAWKDAQYMPTGRKMNLSEKAMRKTEFYNQKRLLKARVMKVLPSDARSVTFDSEKLIVK
jgi:hypothetical protein